MPRYKMRISNTALKEETIMREKILGSVAWTLLAVGVSTANSECILIPFLITLAGALLLLHVCH